MQVARVFDVCQLPLVVLLPALLYTLYAAQHARTAVGEVVHVRPSGARALRIAFVALCVLLGVATSAWAEGQSEPETLWPALVPAFESLGLASLLAWFAPGAKELCVGREGLRSGWSAWRFDAMEQVRLEGASLHFDHEDRAERIVLDARSFEIVRARLAGADASEP